MKIFFTLFVINAALATQGQPPADNACSGNNPSATTCSWCYNYGLGTVGARVLNGTSCSTKVADTSTAVVTDCLIYAGDIGTTRTNAKSCNKCNSKTWMNFDSTGTNSVACSNTAVQGSDNGCTDTAIDNCDQMYCNKADAATSNKGCRRCASAFKGNGQVLTGIGYPTCQARTIDNCDIAEP